MDEKSNKEISDKLLSIVTLFSLISWISIGFILFSIVFVEFYARGIGGGVLGNKQLGTLVLIAANGFVFDVVTLTWAWGAIEKNYEFISKLMMYISIGVLGITFLTLILIIRL